MIDIVSNLSPLCGQGPLIFSLPRPHCVLGVLWSHQLQTPHWILSFFSANVWRTHHIWDHSLLPKSRASLCPRDKPLIQSFYTFQIKASFTAKDGQRCVHTPIVSLYQKAWSLHQNIMSWVESCYNHPK